VSEDAPHETAVCSCCGGRLVDAVVEHAWSGLMTPWTLRLMLPSVDPESRTAKLVALYVHVRVPVVAKMVSRRNRNRLLDMTFEKQASVILELVARGLLS